MQETIAGVLGIKKEDVTCHVTLLGGGFGRKSKPDQVAEAAILSKQLGKPVKVVWSREDDIHFDFFHSVAAMYMKAAVGPDGKPTAWLQRTVYPPIDSTFDVPRGYADDEMGLGLEQSSVRYSQSSRGKWPRRLSCAHRMAAQRGQHLSCVRDSFLCRRTCGTARRRIRRNICSI